MHEAAYQSQMIEDQDVGKTVVDTEGGSMLNGGGR